MPRAKKDPHDWPSLNNWLNSIGIQTEEIKMNFLYSALIDYFPGANRGSHRIPTKEEISKERTRLTNTILSFNPEIIVPVGKLSIEYCLGRKVKLLKEIIGKTYRVDPYQIMQKEVTILPLPHPSGASTWKYKNNELLTSALRLLEKEIRK